MTARAKLPTYFDAIETEDMALDLSLCGGTNGVNILIDHNDHVQGLKTVLMQTPELIGFMAGYIEFLFTVKMVSAHQYAALYMVMLSQVDMMQAIRVANLYASGGELPFVRMVAQTILSHTSIIEQQYSDAAQHHVGMMGGRQ